jgi:trans-aconitate methyltransferase
MKAIFGICLFAAAFLQAKGVEDAQGYHLNSELQLKAAGETIDAISWTDFENILDIGCGDGKITASIAKKCPQGSVVGLDISPSMIDFASAHYLPSPNLRFLQGDAADLPFENQFDLAVSFSTLHWVLDQSNALRQIQKALVPGGKIYLMTYGKSPMNVSTVGEELVSTPKWAPYFSSYTQQRVFYTEEEYRAVLETSGFVEVKLTSEWAQTLFPNREALIGFIKPLLNYTKHLSEELQQTFAEEIAEKIRAMTPPTMDGSIPYATLKLQAVAKKPTCQK